VDLKSDQRRNRRLKCEAVIWHNNLLPEIFYNAKMYNLSKEGVYFESDQIIYPGEDIYIGLKKSASSINDNKDHIHVEIKWRKDLHNASFRFGYGAKLINPINGLAISMAKANFQQPNTQINAFKNKKDPRKHPRKPFRRVFFFTSINKHYKGLISNISRPPRWKMEWPASYDGIGAIIIPIRYVIFGQDYSVDFFRAPL